MASDHDESDDDEFAGLIAASETSWSAPVPTRSRKRGRETAVDADDAAPPAARMPAARTRRRLAPSREGASSAGGAKPRGGLAAGASTPADDAGSMPPPPPRRVLEASDDASDEDSGDEFVASPSSSRTKASEYYGVCGRGETWQAQIHRPARLGFDGKEFYIGTHPTELEAARAVDLYIHEHVPSLSAKANFPPGHVYDVAPSAPKGRGASKYYGVSRNRSGGPRWQAYVILGKKLGYDPPKTKHIGSYSTELAAAQAVDDYIYTNVRGLIPKANFPRDN